MPDPGRDVPLQNIATNLGALTQAQESLASAITLLAQNLLFQSYSTGTWTPGLSFGGGATGISYSSQSGSYTQLGREFICLFAISLITKGASTGVAAITGLPGLSNAMASEAGAGGSITNYGSLTSITSLPFIAVGASSSMASLFLAGSTASLAMHDTNFGSGSSITGRFGFSV